MRRIDRLGAVELDGALIGMRRHRARSVAASKIEARFMLTSIGIFSPGRLTSCACSSATTGAPAMPKVA